MLIETLDYMSSIVIEPLKGGRRASANASAGAIAFGNIYTATATLTYTIVTAGSYSIKS